jgi:Ca-activated chloride channel family protein
MSLTVRTDRKLLAAGGATTRYAVATIVAPPGAPSARPPANLAFVLDRSGSMSGSKIALAREAVRQSIGRLRPDDRFALVVYDDQIDVVMASTPASAEARRAALDRLAQTGARGSTNLGGGWLRGCEQVAAHLTGDQPGRVLLLTDGLANQGITEPAALERHARELATRGVRTSTFGVGVDFDERLLQAMADAGGGNFYFIERARQIPDLLTSELQDVLDITARDVTLEVTLPPGVTAKLLGEFAQEDTPGRVRIKVGDLAASQEVRVVFELTFQGGAIGQHVSALFAASASRGFDGTHEAELGWTYAGDEENARSPREVVVDRAVAEAHAARARDEALRLNLRGDFAAAGRLCAAARTWVQDLADGDVMLASLADELAEDEARVAATMSAGERIGFFYRAATALRSRAADGRSRGRERPAGDTP